MRAAQLFWRSGTNEYLYKSCQVSDFDSSPATSFEIVSKMTRSGESGCDVVTVQRAMGHSAASFTLNTYSHLWPKADDRTRNAAAQMLTESLTAARVRPEAR